MTFSHEGHILSPGDHEIFSWRSYLHEIAGSGTPYSNFPDNV